MLDTPYKCSPKRAELYHSEGTKKLYRVVGREQRIYHIAFEHVPGFFVRCKAVWRVHSMRGYWHRRVNPGYLAADYIHSGSMNYRIDDISFVAEPGDIVLCPPDSDYEFGIETPGVWSSLLIQGGMVYGLCDFLRPHFCFSDYDDHSQEKLMELLFKPENQTGEKLSLLCYEFLNALPLLKPGSKYPAILNRILNKIHNNLEKPLPISSLIGESSASMLYINRLFRKHLNTTPHQYIIDQRMTAAGKMLKSGSFSVKEVAFAVGYPNPLNFSTEFKKRYGCSPKAYKMTK